MFFKNINQIQYHVHHVYPYPLSGSQAIKKKKSWEEVEHQMNEVIRFLTEK